MFPIVGWKSAELKIPGEREGEGGGEREGVGEREGEREREVSVV